MSKVEVPAKPGSASLAEFEIVVAVAPESGADQLVRDLQRARAKVRRLWPMPDKLPSDADVLVVEFSDRLTDRLPWAPSPSWVQPSEIRPSHKVELSPVCSASLIALPR